MSDAHAFRPTHEMHAIDAVALGAYLRSVGMELDASRPIAQFATGLANINYRLCIDGRDVVLRRPPDGDLPPGAYDMKREHRILSALSKVFQPAPDSYHLCEDHNVIGVPFQIMEYRPGRVIKGSDPGFLGDDREKAAAVGEMLVGAMADLHGVDAEAAGLGDFGRPEGFIERAIKGWRTRADRLQPARETKHLIDEIGHWLAQQTVRQRAPTLLHCDIKLDNCIVDPETLELRAIVDWDMGTRGDPMFDLATMLSYWTEAGDPDCMHRLGQMPTAAAGFQTRDEIAMLYARRTGRDVSDLAVWRVLAIFKLATVLAQLYATFGQGPDSREDYRGLDQLARELYDFAHQMMQTAD